MSRNGIHSLVVGADVGGSKAHVRIESITDRAVVVEQVLTNTGWAGRTDGARAELLARMIAQVADGAGRIAAVVAGVHGSDSAEQQAILSAPLEKLYPRVSVLNDSNLLVPAQGLRSGTGVAAGTGSSATSIGRDGRILTVGGWGWILGDEGGGVGLMRDAARQVLDAFDREEEDPLCDLLLEALSVTHPHGLSHHLATTDPRLWAAAAPVVFAALAAGSHRARIVIEAHAEAMAGMVELLARRGGDVDTVVAGGGVLVNQPKLFEAFAKAVRRRLARPVSIVLLNEPPVVGAVNLAHELAASAVHRGKGDST